MIFETPWIYAQAQAWNILRDAARTGVCTQDAMEILRTGLAFTVVGVTVPQGRLLAALSQSLDQQAYRRSLSLFEALLDVVGETDMETCFCCQHALLMPGALVLSPPAASVAVGVEAIRKIAVCRECWPHLRTWLMVRMQEPAADAQKNLDPAVSVEGDSSKSERV